MPKVRVFIHIIQEDGRQCKIRVSGLIEKPYICMVEYTYI